MPALRHLLNDRRGTATIEFVLVLPVALFLSLALLQLVLLMGGYIFVHYAAFAATRSAIVYIPHDFGDDGERANHYVASESSPKRRAIHRAAAVALAPVSGRDTTGSAAASAFTSGLESYYQAAGVTTPRWVATLAADRFRYAFNHTTITVNYAETDPLTGDISFQDIGDSDSHTFGPKDAVSVRVHHRFFLSVPYVRWLFADGSISGGGDSGSGGYALIAAAYTLTNEGIATNLPPAPAIGRAP